MLQAWRRGEEKELARGYGKSLKSVIFINPLTGKEEEYILFGQKDWSIILPITVDEKVVAVRQFKQGCNKLILELPAGTASFEEETPEEIAQREFEEETGYEADKFINLGPPLWIASRSSWTRFWTFLALGCEKTKESKLDDSEQIEVELFSLREWIKMTTGTAEESIEETSSITTTHRAIPHLMELGY